MTFPSVKSIRFFTYFNVLIFLSFFASTKAQIKVDLSTLSAFNNPTANWKLEGNVNADINKPHTFTYTAGKGILMNLPDSAEHKDLFTTQKFSDVDIELDCISKQESGWSSICRNRQKALFCRKDITVDKNAATTKLARIFYANGADAAGSRSRC